MGSKAEQLKDRVTTDLEAGKKAFHNAMAKAQSQIDVTTKEIHQLRAELKAQTAEAKTKTMARVDELAKSLDETRKEQEHKIEARLKEIHTATESMNAEVTHATAEGRTFAEARAKAVREEYDSARSALNASLDEELAEWKARIATALEAAAGKKEEAKAAVQAKTVDLHTKHEAAQKKLQSLKQANAAAFGELHRGVRTAIAEVATAVQHARAEIGKAS